MLRHTVALFDPQGLRIKSFKAPTEEELERDFLWRVRNELPGPGIIGIFDRSHYEDVLIARVRELAPGRRSRSGTTRSTPSRPSSSTRARRW